MKFEERLRLLRAETGLSQKQTAEILGITLRQYQRFEGGEQRPGFDNLIKMADHFQISLDWFTGRKEDRG